MRLSVDSVFRGLRVGLPLALLALFGTGAFAGERLIAEGDSRIGYWTRADGSIVRNNYGECYHTLWWKPEHAVEGCDPVPMAPEPVVEMAPEPLKPVVGTVYFDFDKHLLDNEDRRIIDDVIANVGSATITQINLGGHADRIGTDTYNMGLSSRRVNSVKDYLLANHGVNPRLIELEAFGEEQPEVFCEDKLGWKALVECLQPNRRVSIEVVRE